MQVVGIVVYLKVWFRNWRVGFCSDFSGKWSQCPGMCCRTRCEAWCVFTAIFFSVSGKIIDSGVFEFWAFGCREREREAETERSPLKDNFFFRLQFVCELFAVRFGSIIWAFRLQLSAMTAFGGFEPVFGKAQGRLESSPSHDLLPFLFYLRAKNSDHLLIHLTDFHANTWYSDMSTEYLEDMVHFLFLEFVHISSVCELCGDSMGLWVFCLIKFTRISPYC